MLDSGYDDPEELIRLGEGRYASVLLTMSKLVIRDFRIFKRSLSEAKRLKNIDVAEKYRDQLLRSVVNLASWLASHPLEEQDLDEMEE